MSRLFIEWGGSMRNPKRYSKEFQQRAVRRMKLVENVSQLARDLGVHRTCLSAWKRKLGRQPYVRVRGLARSKDRRTGSQGQTPGRDRRWAVRAVGFFRECLAKDQSGCRDERRWRECLYAEMRSRMRSQGQLSIQRMCELSGVSRANFYRHWARQEPLLPRHPSEQQQE